MIGTMILRMTRTLRGATSKSQDFCAGPNLWVAQDETAAITLEDLGCIVSHLSITRQKPLATLRTFVTGRLLSFGGGGKPQRIVASSRSPSRMRTPPSDRTAA